MERGLQGLGSSSEAAPAEEEAPHNGGCVAWGASLRGSGCSSMERGLPAPEHKSNNTGPRAQGAWDTAQDPTSPQDRQRPGVPRTARTLLPEAEQISGPACRASRHLQTESSVVTVGTEFRAQEQVNTTGVFTPGASWGKQTSLSPAPGRGQSSSLKC